MNSLWRFDWNPDLRDLILREAEALTGGEPVGPGLFRSSAPFAPGRGAFALSGGELVAQAASLSELPGVPEPVRVHVPKGPWKAPGNPVDFLRAWTVDASLGPRGCEWELYVAPEQVFLIRAPRGARGYRAPELPYRTSTGLSSQLARAVVNLVARPGDSVWDPVCGTGVLLVEAARIGCQVLGSDRNQKACHAARKNLLEAELEGEVRVRDALLDEGLRYDVVVGDLPYGIRLKQQDLSPFAVTLPKRGRRWALVADIDLSPALRAAGHRLRFVVRVPKPTFTRYVFVGGAWDD